MTRPKKRPPRTVEELIAKSKRDRPLINLSDDNLVEIALTDLTEEGAWNAVVELHFRATRQVFEIACRLTESECVEERVLGCDIMGQLGIPERAFPSEACTHLLRLLADESNPEVLSAVIIALSHLGAEQVVDVAKDYVQHWDSQVRRAIATSLGSFDCDESVSLMTTLSRDQDDEVREWATYWLGFLNAGDAQVVTTALRARLDDTNDEVRKEAIQGLERRLKRE